MEFLNGLTMGRRRLSGLASRRNSLRLTLTENADNTVDLAWTDPVTRTEGSYAIRQNGVLVDTVPYDDPLTYADAAITDPVEDSRWQIIYLNSAGSPRDRSNSETILGLKRYAESWRDYENAVTLPARRLTAASSQYLEMAHASDLNLTTAATMLVWCKKAQSLNQSNCVFLTKGQQDVNIVYGLYGGNYANLGGDTLSFKTATTSTDQSAEAGNYLGAFAWSYAPSTAKAFRNGSAVTLGGGTAPSALTTNSQPIRIGGDGGTGVTWKYFDGWLFAVAIWNRTLSDADLLTLTAGNTPPTYEDLETLVPGASSGLIRWFDLGESLTCKVSSVVLTESGGSTTIEDQIISTTDRSNGLVYEAPTGRWPTLRDDIFETMPTAFHDALANESGSGHSRCCLRATLNQSNLPYTESTGRIVSLMRYTGAFHGTEQWHDTVDSGAANRYVLDGYISITGPGGTLYHALRYRNSEDDGDNISNGEWYSSQTPSLNTNYKNDWRYDGSVFTHKLNNSYDTVTPLFSGTTPAWVNEIDGQIYSGTSPFGGSCALGHVGPAIKFNGIPSDLVNSKLDQYLADFYGMDDPESDLAGEAYATAIEAAGYTYTGDDRQHDIDLFRNMRRDGVLHLIKEGILPVYADATVNRVKMIARTNGTYNGGSNTHAAGKVTFGASGYFNFGQNLTQLGLGAATDCGLALIFANNDAAGTNIDFALNSGTGNILELTANYNNSGRKGYFRLGGANNNVLSFEGVDLSGLSTVAGIWQMTRVGAEAHVAFNDYTTDTVVAQGSSFSGGSLPNINPLLGCLNTNGTPSLYSLKGLRGGFITLGMTQAQSALFRANTKTWLTARGFI